jgi:hypothetical protein
MMEQQMQPQQAPQTVVFSDSSQSNATLYEKIRPDETVEVLRNRLMGKEYKENKWQILPYMEGKALSEKGAFELATLMLPASNPTVTISKLNDKEIRERTLSITKTAMKMCLKNWKEYNIWGSDKFAFIKEVVQTNTFVSLKLPDGAGGRALIAGTSEFKHTTTPQQSENKGIGGFLARIKR